SAPAQVLDTPSLPAQIGPNFPTSGFLQLSTPLRSAMFLPLIEPPMMLGCLPLGGWCPEIVPRSTWLLLVMITLASAVPPRATNRAITERTWANVRWRRMRLMAPPFETMACGERRTLKPPRLARLPALRRSGHCQGGFPRPIPAGNWHVSLSKEVIE